MVYTDQIGKTIDLAEKPRKIISLVPSQTELLFHLGLKDQVAGVTKFCIHPKSEVAGKTIVGGTKKFRFDVIDALNPDLILANKEENYLEGIRELSSKYPVWTSDINNLTDALDMINSIGLITGTPESAQELSSEIASVFENKPTYPKRTVVYLIWKEPLMVAGQGSFINSMLAEFQFKNVIEENRYPSIAPELIRQLAPDIIFLPSEPFPFKEKHREEFRKLSPQSEVMLVDGEMFSWYGNRLLKSVPYVAKLRADIAG